MTPQGLVTSLAAFVLAVFLYLIFVRRVGQRTEGLPPGPPTLPIIGNLHQLPLRPEETGSYFENWAHLYGPVYSLMLGPQVWIVLCKDWAVKDLLDRRGAIYSSRPDAYLAQDIFSGGLRSFFLKDDEKDGKFLKRNRRLGRAHLNESVSRAYIPYQDLENKAMLVGFLEQPELFIRHIKRFTTSLTTSIVFGFRVLSEDDALTKRLFYLFDRFSETCFSLTAILLDAYPRLRCLPDLLVPGKWFARAMHKMERETFLDLHLRIKEKNRHGTAPPCFSRELIRSQEEQEIGDAEAAYISGSLLQGGLGSTTETLTGFIKAMVLFPDVVRMAQQELDAVCAARMPELDDWPELGYVRGCVKEALRWMPASPLGVPHALTRDDEYMGYRFPKGATVIYNVRAIHNDSERYVDPRTFNPMRWAQDDQTAAQAASNPDVSQRDHFMFGAGRRICQGIHIAERSLFLAVSRLLWAFDIEPAGDGVAVSDADDLQGGIFVMPRPFLAQIAPRDADKAALVRAAWQEASDRCLDENLQWKEGSGQPKRQVR